MIKGLRIKKTYWVDILNNKKTCEYRKANSYFKKFLFKEKITHLKLHYQSKENILAEIDTITEITTPDDLLQYAFLDTPTVFKITFKSIKYNHE